MAITQEINLESLEAAIIARLTANFPDVKTIIFDYDRQAKIPELPAILLELTQAEPDEDTGTGQLHLVGRFEARCLIGALTTGHGHKARKLSLNLARYIYQTRWGEKQTDQSESEVQPVTPAQVIGCYPDDFDPRFDQLDVWRVDWEQSFYVGESVWQSNAEIPQQVFVGENGDNHHLLIDDRPPTP